MENDDIMYAKAKVNIALDGCRFLCFLPMEQTQKSGFVDSYRYQAVAVTTDSGDTATMYIFLNSERELSTFLTFLLASVGISIAGLLLVFCLVVFFSKKAVKPVAESYEKQKRFITDASHEIKTPLTIIDANTEVIEMTNGENPVCHSGTGCNNKRRRSYLKAACLPSVRQCNQIWN